MSPETPEADAVEQARPADEVPDEEVSAEEASKPTEMPLVDANPADLVEQHQVVPEDDSYDRR